MKHKSRNSRPTTSNHFEHLEVKTYFAAYIAGNPTPYAMIQAAVDAASPGATINVEAGTYAETVVIGKQLTLRGAQAGVDGRGTRGAESILYTSPTGFRILANGVTIDGFTVRGTKANIGAGLGAGIVMGPGTHGSKILNNIIKENVTGLYLANNSDTDAAVISRNLFYNNTETGSDWTYGWNGSRGIYTDGEVSGGYLTNVLIDSNKFYRDDSYTGEGMIALAAGGADKQFNITISRNVFQSPNSVSSKAILVFNTANLSFIGNDVSGQNDGSSGPVRFEGNADNVNIQYNNIHDNGGPAVAIDSAGVEGDSSGFTIRYNNFTSNRSNIGVIVRAIDYIGPVVATNNWWGNASGPSGQGTGTGASVWGDGVTGHYTTPQGKAGGDVTFNPWSTTAINIANVPAPIAASALVATGASSDSIALAWNAPYSTATSQLIQRSTDGTNFVTVATVSPLVNSYADKGLTSGARYYYRVVASNFAGDAAPSNVANAVPPGYQLPVAPTGLTVNGTTTTTVTLSWTPPVNAVGITGYIVYRNGTAVGTSNALTFTDTGLTANSSYVYTVATTDNRGAVSNKTLAVTAITKVAQFNDAGFETTRVAVNGYAYTPTSASWTFIGRTGITANNSAWGAAAAPEGTQVAFIQSNGSAISRISQNVSINPAGNYTISFKAAQRNGYGVNPIIVSVDGVVVGTITPTASTFATFTTSTIAMTAGTHTIAFTGTANAADTASFIDGVSLMLVAPATPPATPTGLTASAISKTQVALAWSASGTTPVSYTLSRSVDGATFTTINTAISGAATSYTDATGLVAGTTYYYKLVAVNAAGSSAASNAASATTLTAAAITTPLSSLPWTTATSGYSTPQLNTSVVGNPLKLRGVTYPSGIGTHAVSNISYNLGGAYTTFQADVGVDDAVDASRGAAVIFRVYGDGVLLFDSGVLTRNSATASIGISVAGVQTLTLTATNGVNGTIDYDHADWAGAQLSASPQAPAAPTNLLASVGGNNTAQLNWTATGSNQTSFKLERSIAGGAWIQIAASAGTSYLDSGLTAGVAYSYRVRAVNTVGESANSNVATFTPAATTTTFLSDLNWTSATSGWSTVQKNKSVKGNAITLRGTTYAKGLGTHAVSTITYNLAGQYSNFASDVGIDDAIGVASGAAIIFRVYGDGVLLFDSGVLTRTSATASINVSVANVQTLTLVATNGVTGTVDFDHADWANARLLAAAKAPVAPVSVAATATSATTIGLTWAAGGATHTGYRVERSADNGATWTAIATPGASVTSYTDGGLTASTTYTYRVFALNTSGTSPASPTASAKTFAATSVTTQLSTLNWTSATTGYGAVTKNASMKDNALKLGGVTYASGIGTHAESTITYDLTGKSYTSFLSDVGIDDEVVGIGTGSAVFRVYGDGVLLFDSGVRTSGTAALSLAVNIAGVKTLTLVAAAAPGGDVDFAHADWANARLVSA